MAEHVFASRFVASGVPERPKNAHDVSNVSSSFVVFDRTYPCLDVFSGVCLCLYVTGRR